MSARSSARVSNSEASEANSSSSSGRIFSRTSLTLTLKTASSPARCSAWYSSGKVTLTSRSSPALGAGELLLEALDQLARAERQQVVLRLAALERLVVEQALEVDQQRVALGGLALDRLEAGEALADPLDLGVDNFVRDLFLGRADLEALVVAELGRGAHADLELEPSGWPSSSGVVDHLDAGIADRVDAGGRAAPVRTIRAAPRGSPPAGPGRSRAAGSPARAAPCRPESPASASLWPSRGRRARRRGRRPLPEPRPRR